MSGGPPGSCPVPSEGLRGGAKYQSQWWDDTTARCCPDGTQHCHCLAGKNRFYSSLPYWMSSLLKCPISNMLLQNVPRVNASYHRTFFTIFTLLEWNWKYTYHKYKFSSKNKQLLQKKIIKICEHFKFQTTMLSRILKLVVCIFSFKVFWFLHYESIYF